MNPQKGTTMQPAGSDREGYGLGFRVLVCRELVDGLIVRVPVIV